jgi:hypothetical protein
MSLCRSRLRGNLLHLGIRQLVDNDGRENHLKTTNQMTFHNLSGDVGNKNLQ